MNIKPRLLLAAALLAVSSHGHSQSLEINVYRPGNVSLFMNAPIFTVQLAGTIDPGSPERLREKLKIIPPDYLIQFYLDSPGGNIAASMELGRIIRNRGVSTHVGMYAGEERRSVPGICYSACAFAYLGGPFRWVSEASKYGVHRFFTRQPTSRDMEVAQILSASLAGYIREMEADPDLLTVMAQTPKEQLTVLDKKQLDAYRVVNNGRRPAKWSIEAIPVGLYLKGEQLTYFGLGKALFFCDVNSGRIIFNSLAPIAPDQAPSMEKGEWEHSLIVDKDNLPLPKTMGVYDGTFLMSSFALTPAHIARVSQAKTVGHAMQIAKESPIFVGYQVDILPEQRQKIQNFLGTCQRSK